jgi:DNA-directed RNA polymerase specialized sigma24 family protein
MPEAKDPRVLCLPGSAGAPHGQAARDSSDHDATRTAAATGTRGHPVKLPSDLFFVDARNSTGDKLELRFAILRFRTSDLLAARIRKRYGLSPIDVEFVLDDIYEQAKKSVATFNPAKATKPLAWLWGIARHRVVRYIARHRGVMPMAPGVDVPDGRSSVSEVFERARADPAQIIRQALDQLRIPRRRRAVVYHFFDHKSYAQIRELMGLPNDQSAVQLVYYARRDLRQILLRLGHDKGILKLFSDDQESPGAPSETQPRGEDSP